MLSYESLKKNLFLIAGPCVLEEEKTVYEIAEFLVKLTEELKINFIFKASYLKANRTSFKSFSGPGLPGLKLLRQVRENFGVPVLTDVHETAELPEVSEVADIIQIPAFLARQTFLLGEAAKTGKMINIKKAQFMAPEDMSWAAEKIVSQGNNQVILTERGTCFGYHNLVVDFRSFAQLSEQGFPVVYDVTHSLQKPSLGKVSGGTPSYVPMMARAALATGKVSGLFIETHPDPANALSDSASMIKLDVVPTLLEQCIRVYGLVKDLSHDPD